MLWYVSLTVLESGSQHSTQSEATMALLPWRLLEKSTALILNILLITMVWYEIDSFWSPLLGAKHHCCAIWKDLGMVPLPKSVNTMECIPIYQILVDPLSRSALTEKHGKHDGFPCPPERLASGNCRAEKPQTPSAKGSRGANAKDLLFSRWPIAGKFWNATDATVWFLESLAVKLGIQIAKVRQQGKTKVFCISADCAYRIQSHVLDSSSGKRNAAAASATDSSPPWHMSNTQSKNICGWRFSWRCLEHMAAAASSWASLHFCVSSKLVPARCFFSKYAEPAGLPPKVTHDPGASKQGCWDFMAWHGTVWNGMEVGFKYTQHTS